MPSISELVAKNQTRVSSGGAIEVSPDPGTSAPLPTPQHDLPMGLPQRGIFPASLVLASDRSDNSRDFRSMGTRSATFPYQPTPVVTAKTVVQQVAPPATVVNQTTIQQIGGNILVGPIASLPTNPPSGNGSLYFCTDAMFTFASVGGVWQAYAYGYPVQNPVIASFTPFQPVTATLITSTIRGELTAVQAAQLGGDVLNGWTQPAPTPPYSIVIGFRTTMANLGRFPQAGFFVRDSATGKCQTWSAFSPNTTTGAITLQTGNYTQPASGFATFSSAPNQVTITPQYAYFLKFFDDGVNFNFAIGPDPFDFVFIPSFQLSRTSWVPSGGNQVGFFIDPNNNLSSPQATTQAGLFHWAQGTS